jgi:hypothetical protein
VTIRKPLVILLLALVIVQPGCGTILGLGMDREVFIATNPSGATLYKNGIATSVVSPSPVELDPSEEWRIDAHLDDLKGGTQITRSRRIGVCIADILLTAGLGLFVDYLSGAMYFFPDRVILNLGRSSAGGPASGGAADPGMAEAGGRADPTWPQANTGGPPERGEQTGGETSTRSLLGTTKR